MRRSGSCWMRCQARQDIQIAGRENLADGGAAGGRARRSGAAGLLRQIAGAVRKLKFLNPPRLGGQPLSKG